MINTGDRATETIQTNFQDYSQIILPYNQSLFTHHHWIESISGHNAKPIYLLIKKKDELVAKIAGLSVQRSWWRRKELYFYSAPQLSDPTNPDIRQILTSILTYAKTHGYNRLVISSYDNRHNTLEAIPEVYLNQRQEYVFDLNQPDPHLAHKPTLVQKLRLWG